jgi:hypothetical protein
MKKAVLVLFVFAFAGFELFGQNDSDFEYEKIISWLEKELGSDGSPNEITITGYKGNVKNVIIPERINGLVVVAIGDNAFFNKGLTSVLLPNTITRIGENSFANNHITSIVLPISHVSIGRNTFSNNRISNVIIHDPYTTYISNNSFDSNVVIIRQNIDYCFSLLGFSLLNRPVPDNFTLKNEYAENWALYTNGKNVRLLVNNGVINRIDIQYDLDFRYDSRMVNDCNNFFKVNNWEFLEKIEDLSSRYYFFIKGDYIAGFSDYPSSIFIQRKEMYENLR